MSIIDVSLSSGLEPTTKWKNGKNGKIPILQLQDWDPSCDFELVRLQNGKMENGKWKIPIMQLQDWDFRCDFALVRLKLY